VSVNDLSGMTGRRPRRALSGLAGRRWRRVAGACAVVLLVIGAVTARIFIWPAASMPPRVSAIVMVDGPGDPLSVAVGLARQHRAPFLVVSLGSPGSSYSCPGPIPGVRLICFNPKPATTAGEAQFVGSLARKFRWKSVALVAITPQGFRARLRVERCFTGRVYLVTAPLPLSSWPYQIAYQWAALAKALVVQRGC